jgi:ketosteroid isomerase-like protein
MTQFILSMLVNKSIVYEYFRLIKQKDINGLLSLFADDAIVYEPFSKIATGFSGKDAIKTFLEIVMMANSGLTYNIVIDGHLGSSNNNDDDNVIKKHHDDGDNCKSSNTIAALIAFQGGDSIRARFTFESVVPILTKSTKTIISLKKKIQRLNIQFIR